MSNKQRAIDELIYKIRRGEIRSKRQLEHAKRTLSDKYGLVGIIRNSELLETLDEMEKEKYRALLMKRPVRSVSGVVVTAVMAPPSSCPGKCIYCPQGEDAPKSYTGFEPASMRAKQMGFDAYRQVRHRIKQLESVGHATDKVELIIMGGTFPSLPVEEQRRFIKRCFDALNETEARTLEESHKLNEKSRHRCVSLTIETRPDFCREEHINLMLELGTTRVELGVQSLNPEVLKKVKRGHGIGEVIKATQLLKDAGLKVCYHLMPGLFQSVEDDINMMRKLFRDERFMPDMLKIYPTLVIEGTLLYELWKEGKYEPLDNDSAAELIARAKAFVPEWCRIMRVQRDIPAGLINAGVMASNLREHVQKKAKELGIKCRCIRCREAGHKFYKENVIPENEEVVVREYKASGGREFFISMEDAKNDVLLGFCRLRFPYKPFRPEIRDSAAIVRELKVFGTALPLSIRSKLSFQHRGYGRALMEKAEEIARTAGYERLAVISAVGTREYYRKLGYGLEGAYMLRAL